MLRTIARGSAARLTAVAASSLLTFAGCGSGDASAGDDTARPSSVPSTTPLATVPSTASATLPEPRAVYTVKPGDQLRYICRKYKITLQDVIAFNQLDSPDHIEVGQKIKIPPKGWHRPEPPPGAAPQSAPPTTATP